MDKRPGAKKFKVETPIGSLLAALSELYVEK
jgi:hypothetical protein